MRGKGGARLLVGAAIACLFGTGCGASKPAPARAPAPSVPAPPAAPAVVTAGSCDKALFHRWETGKLAENCMAARPCVLDERLVDLSCAGHPDPAGCLRRCVTSGLGFIAEAYRVEPPDLGACVACLGDGYARMVLDCGANCPACPSDSTEGERCNACAKAGRFFAACLD